MMTGDVRNAGTDFLRKIYIFQDLDEAGLEAVAGISRLVEAAADDIIMKEDEPGSSMFVIASGQVQVAKVLTMKFGEDDFRETEKTMSILSADDHVVFGEMALVSDTGRSATVTAVTSCTLYEITREDFLALAEERPDLGFRVILRIAEILSRRLKKTGEDVIRLTTALSIALSP